jgi:hypothetical protein
MDMFFCTLWTKQQLKKCNIIIGKIFVSLWILLLNSNSNVVKRVNTIPARNSWAKSMEVDPAPWPEGKRQHGEPTSIDDEISEKRTAVSDEKNRIKLRRSNIRRLWNRRGSLQKPQKDTEEEDRLHFSGRDHHGLANNRRGNWKGQQISSFLADKREIRLQKNVGGRHPHRNRQEDNN